LRRLSNEYNSSWLADALAGQQLERQKRTLKQKWWVCLVVQEQSVALFSIVCGLQPAF